MTEPAPDQAEFDRYAEAYDAALAQGLSVSGEDKNYFARGRIAFLSRCLSDLPDGVTHPSILDFGCGTGSAAPFLLDLLYAGAVLGVDVSPGSLAVARREHGSERTRFLLPAECQPQGDQDLAFCNGVFHHIPPGKRREAVDTVFRSLRSGGLFAFWENHWANPGTRYVMSRCPFDGDAVPLTPSEARDLLRAGGFQILRTDFLFIFPRVLRALRFLEPRLSRLPLGTQYQILCRKP